MKVGTLALLREGYQVSMQTSADRWSFQLAYDATFDERVLTVFVTPRAAPSDATAADEVQVPGLRPTDTATVIRGLSQSMWESMLDRFLFLEPPSPSEVLSFLPCRDRMVGSSRLPYLTEWFVTDCAHPSWLAATG